MTQHLHISLGPVQGFVAQRKAPAPVDITSTITTHTIQLMFRARAAAM